MFNCLPPSQHTQTHTEPLSYRYNIGYDSAKLFEFFLATNAFSFTDATNDRALNDAVQIRLRTYRLILV